MIAVVFIKPITCSHEEKLEQDRVSEGLCIAGTDLTRDPISIFPQPIVPMSLSKNIIVPTIVFRPLRPRQHQFLLRMTRDLNEESTPTHCNEGRLLLPQKFLGTALLYWRWREYNGSCQHE